jgi:hypothetical protein
VAGELDLTAAAKAILAEVQAASGLQQGQVVFGDQRAGAPDQDYVTVRVDGPGDANGPPARRHDFDSGRPAGQEVRVTFSGPVELLVYLQGFSGQASGGKGAHAVLTLARARLQLPPALARLKAAGLAVLDFGRVANTPRLSSGAMEGRAFLDLTLLASSGASYDTGYIATTDVDFDFRP